MNEKLKNLYTAEGYKVYCKYHQRVLSVKRDFPEIDEVVIAAIISAGATLACELTESERVALNNPLKSEQTNNKGDRFV